MPDFGLTNIPDFSLPEIELPIIKEIRNYNLADYTYEIIMDEIKQFEESLDDDHEVALRLTSFGQSILMSVTDIRYANPSTLIFDGLVDGQSATLVQHVSQLSFLLWAVRKTEPEKPAKRIAIGFHAPSEG